MAAISAWRITLTPPVINAAAQVAFLVSGKEKAPMLHRVIDGAYLPAELPAQMIAPCDGHLRWLVDAAAANGLQCCSRIESDLIRATLPESLGPVSYGDRP
jgi:6-phosphogluconolactonase/glucosamine-6-phosphate isomerase/deaminase